jgi:hypothetical protein
MITITFGDLALDVCAETVGAVQMAKTKVQIESVYVVVLATMFVFLNRAEWWVVRSAEVGLRGQRSLVAHSGLTHSVIPFETPVNSRDDA